MNDSDPSRQPAIIVAGPTGAGKTELAIRLARRRPFDLISADSMQVYRGMEIGTAQPTDEELGGVSLANCGVLEPDEPFSVKHFLDLSSQAHRRTIERSRIPLYVGGTGLYLRALRWGIFEGPDGNAELRDELWREARRIGSEAMHLRLREVDPELSSRIDPGDTLRIVRALEVARATGRKLSSLQTQWDERRPRFEHVLIIITCPRPVLIERIENRVDAMIAAGWIDEVSRLIQQGGSPSLHCFKAIGYREISAYLRGETAQEEMIDRIKARTRQFAKRQMTWLRKEPDAHWIQYEGDDLTSALDEIEKLLE